MAAFLFSYFLFLPSILTSLLTSRELSLTASLMIFWSILSSLSSPSMMTGFEFLNLLSSDAYFYTVATMRDLVFGGSIDDKNLYLID
jgi:hypothetical protein